MRQLTDSERKAMQAPLHDYWVKRDGLLPKESRAFEAGFTAGLEYQQAKLGPILACDFDTVHEAGKRLREIVERDFVADVVRQKVVGVGAEDYVVRAVIEALFGNSDTL